MTTYTFTGAVAYDRLGSSWRTAAGLRSVSVTDPATGLLPTNLVQGGVAVSWLTADANSRYSFSCDVPGVVVDFGAGAQALYANEVPGLMVSASSTYEAINAVDPMSAPYNAVGDGVTDDSTSWQAALTAAAATGATLRPRSGKTFAVAATINATGVVIDGNGATFKAKTGLTGNLLMVGSNTTVKNLKFDGNAISATGLHIYNGGVIANVRILDNEFTNCGLNAIQSTVTTTHSDITIRGNFIHDTAAGGIQMIGTGIQYRIDVSHNIVRNTGATGVAVHGSSAANGVFGLTMVGNRIDVPGMIPLEPFYADGFTITGNIIRAGTFGISFGTCTRGTVSGNTVQGMSSYGVELNVVDTVTISGNTFDSCVVGIECDGSSSRVTVTGNTFSKGSQAIWLATGTTQNQWLIEGNTLVDSTVRGIEIEATVNDIVIVGNTYIITAAPTMAGNACFIMFYGTVTRATVTDNVLSVTQSGAEGNTVGAIRIIATITNCTITGNTFIGTVHFAQSAVSVAAVACAGLRIERNRVINYSDGFRTSDATNDDVVVIDNVIDSTVTTPYTLKSTHLRRTKQSYENTAAPTFRAWAVGDETHHSAPAVGSPKGWLCTVAGGSFTGTWAATTAYALGIWYKTSTGVVMEVTTAGTTSATEPAPTAIGQVVTDGTVTWTCRALTAATFVSTGNL